MRNRLITTLSLAALGGIAMATATAPAQAQGITVNGNVEASYTYNFNKPFDNVNGYYYNNKDAQFQLGLVDLRIGKAATPSSRTGFLIRLIDGEAKKLTLVDGDADNILEAYGTFLAPLGSRDLKVDVGQFTTPIGYETVELGTGNHFSRSLIFATGPFYHLGIRASFPLSGSTTVTGFIVNRLNGADDSGNKDLAPGFQVAHTFSPTSSLTVNGLTSRELGPQVGNEVPVIDQASRGSRQLVFGNRQKQQSILNAVYTNQFGGLKFALDTYYQFGKDDFDRSYDEALIAAYLSHGLPNGNTLSVRGEYGKYNFTGSSQDTKVQEVTATYELKSGLFPGLRTLIEYRYDKADKQIFSGRNDSTFKKNQSTLTIGQSYSF